MPKKKDTSNIKNLGKGILDTLTEMNNDNIYVNKEKNNTVTTKETNTVTEEKGKKVNTLNNKTVNEEDNKTVINEKTKSPKEENSNHSKDDNPKALKEDKNKTSKVKKSKRSFMLTEKSIQKLNMLNAALKDKDLSTIVEESIIMYFDENKVTIEKMFEMYNSLK